MERFIRKYSIEKDFPLSRSFVWKVLGDNDRLNRFIGLFPVEFGKVENKQGGIFYRDAIAKVAGFVDILWKEYPFQWVKNEQYTFERIYEKGPFTKLVTTFEFLESTIYENGCKVLIKSEFTPRNLLGLAAIPLIGIKSMKNTIRYVDEQMLVANGTIEKIHYQKKSVGQVNLEELNRLETLLDEAPVNPDYRIKLHGLLRDGESNDVVKMNPYKVASEWGAEPLEVLRLFLYATKAGLLNLSWNLICPNCRVSKVEYTTLSKLKGQFHCDLCGIDYNADFGKYVELNFSVHPSIRKAYDQVFCVGGPMITPHVHMQRVIQKGNSFAFPLPDGFVKMRIRVLQANHIVTFDEWPEDENIKGMAYTYEDNGWHRSGEQYNLKNDEMMISNESSSDIVVVMEKAEWNQEVVTAAWVTSLQEFRDLFSSEVLSPGQQVGIESVTILFSDLQGSTSLYESIGDADAYGQVRRHFEFLSHWISKNSGGVVKTIGDAVMAVFHLPEDALKAAIQIQEHVSEFNATVGDPIVLKLGLYSGPAIAVNSNDRLDYFGRTVNMAARVQGQSAGHDLVLSEDALQNEKMQAIIMGLERFEIIPFKASLKGINDDVALIQLKKRVPGSLIVQNEEVSDV
ncbi:adenylate/guanylate cyclase domain-containing protein [Peribacillus sp.]|uniref:adenylate/guanylate cyclase domain-containing protein n=1 Tax=Peribacillus sp. TaxID=2675267 RepID=UPI00388D5F8E